MSLAKLGRWIVADWQLKLGGLGIAVVLSIYVRSEERLNLSLRVPLELRNPPATMMYANTPPTAVDVRLEADRNQISSLTPGSVRAVVDLSGVTGLSANIVLEESHIKRPSGVAVLSISPAKLNLIFVPREMGKKKKR